MIVKTETGSIYEIDTTNYKMRRLEGTHAPTKNQGNDKAWQEYMHISPIEVGANLMIEWRIDEVEDKDHPEIRKVIVRRTLTSRIEEIN